MPALYDEIFAVQVPCHIVAVDDILSAPALPLLADLRYLQLLLCPELEEEVMALVNSRKTRGQGQKDTEKLYHPVVLKIYQVCQYGASSQVNVCTALQVCCVLTDLC